MAIKVISAIILFFVITLPIYAHDYPSDFATACPDGHTFTTDASGGVLCVHPIAGTPTGSGFRDNTNIPVPGLKSNFTEQGLAGKIITEILPIILGIAGFITAIMIIVSGIQFITSSGNPEAANAARGRLVYALIGFGVIVLAFAALQIINAIFLGNTGLV